MQKKAICRGNIASIILRCTHLDDNTRMRNMTCRVAKLTQYGPSVQTFTRSEVMKREILFL